MRVMSWRFWWEWWPVPVGAVAGVLLGFTLVGRPAGEAAAGPGAAPGEPAGTGGGVPPPGEPAPTGYTLRDLYDYVASCGSVLPAPGSHGLLPPGPPGTEDMPAVEDVIALLGGRLCTGGGSGAGLPDTGQTLCYDEAGNAIDCADSTHPCFGQDGYYDTGCPPEGRFLDNLDGTVTDRCTGLMWQQGTAPSTYTWCEALRYCEGLSLAGYTDWRLPNVRELQSIADYGRYNPSIDPVFGAVSSWYWSSSSVAQDPGVAWNGLFNHGDVVNGIKGDPGPVRAVRAGP